MQNKVQLSCFCTYPDSDEIVRKHTIIVMHIHLYEKKIHYSTYMENRAGKYKGALLRSHSADQNHSLGTTAKVGLFLWF